MKTKKIKSSELRQNWLAFLRAGGTVTALEWFETMTAKDRDALGAAAEVYRAEQACLLAAALRDPSAVFAVVDGGEAQKKGALTRAVASVAAAPAMGPEDISLESLLPEVALTEAAG